MPGAIQSVIKFVKLLLFMGVVVLTLVCTVGLVEVGPQALAMMRSATYSPVQATVRTSRIDRYVPGQRWRGNLVPHIEYEYAVGTEKYVGTDVECHEGFTFSERRAERLVRSHPAGKVTTVFVSLDDPKTSCLIRAEPNEGKIILAFMFGGLLFGLTGCYLLRPAKAPSANRSYSAPLLTSPVRVAYRNTLAEYRQPIKAHSVRRLAWFKWLVAWAIFFSVATWRSGHSSILQSLLTLGPAVALIPIGFVLGTKRHFESRSDRDQDMSATIDQGSLTLTSKSGATIVNWSAVTEIVQTDRGMLIYTSADTFHWLPFNGFESPEEQKRFQDAIVETVS